MTLSWIIVVTAVFKPLLVWSKTNIFIFISLRRIYNVPNDLLQTLCCHILYCNHQHYFSDVYVLYSCLSSETFTPSHWITGGLLVFWSNKQCCVLLASCKLDMGIYFLLRYVFSILSSSMTQPTDETNNTKVSEMVVNRDCIHFRPVLLVNMAD